jgi:hypothetical protein
MPNWLPRNGKFQHPIALLVFSTLESLIRSLTLPINISWKICVYILPKDIAFQTPLKTFGLGG